MLKNTRYLFRKDLFGPYIQCAYDTVTKQRVILKHIEHPDCFLCEVKNHSQLQQLSIIPELSHAHLSTMIDYYPETNTIMLPYVRGNDMHSTIMNLNKQNKKLSESYVWSWMTKAHSCIEALHNKNRVHLDIKLENFITTSRFDEDDVTLIDFQCMQEVKPNNKLHPLPLMCGTKSYLSPEIYYDKQFLPQSDLWCLGLCGFIIGAQFHPMQRAGVNYNNVQSYVYDNLVGYSQEYRENIARLLSTEPHKRIWIN